MYHSLSIRFHIKTWEKILKLKREQPHFTFNSIIVEAVIQYLEEAGKSPVRPVKAQK